MGWLRTILLGDLGDNLGINVTGQGISRLQEKSSVVSALLHEELEMSRIGATDKNQKLNN